MSVTLESVEQAISAAGFAWQAKETPIALQRSSATSDTELFGLNVTPDELDNAKKETDDQERNFVVPRRLPARIDWRANDGASWLSPVRHQGRCGSCVAFATVASLEARVRINSEDPDLPIALSEADLFFCSGCSCKAGWHMEAALDRCGETGIGSAADFPYSAKDQRCRQIDPVVKIDGYRRLGSANARRYALLEGPVIGGMRVFDDFTYYAGGVYRHVAGEHPSYHAVCIVGYDDDEQFWIVRNSWGANFGEEGYFRIGYGECGLDSDILFYAPDVRYSPHGFRARS